MHDDVLVLADFHSAQMRARDVCEKEKKIHHWQEMAKTIIVTGASKGTDEVICSKHLQSLHYLQGSVQR